VTERELELHNLRALMKIAETMAKHNIILREALQRIVETCATLSDPPSKVVAIAEQTLKDTK
jgi:hypothetical protein